MTRMVGGSEPSAHDVETGICRSSVERVSSRRLIGMFPKEDQVAVARGIPRQPSAFFHRERGFERREA
jgi:hypothetical protein